jgi:hypothetical protein
MTSLAPKTCDKHGDFANAKRCPACTSEYRRAYYKRNRDKMLAQAAAFRASNVDVINEKHRLARLAWDEEKRAAVAAAKAARYAEWRDARTAGRLRSDPVYRENHRKATLDQGSGRVCTGCRIYKPQEDFNKLSTAKNGLHPRCRSCMSEYRAENRAYASEAHRAWREVNGERRREYERQWYQENKDWYRAYRAANRTQIRESKNTSDAKRAQHKRAKSAPISSSKISEKWAYWGGLCPACRSCNSSKHAKWYGPQGLARFIKN